MFLVPKNACKGEELPSPLTFSPRGHYGRTASSDSGRGFIEQLCSCVTALRIAVDDFDDVEANYGATEKTTA